MGSEVFVDQRPVRDAYDNIGTALVTAGAGFTNLLAFRTRCGFRPRLTLVGAGVDPGGESVVTFRVLVNSAPVAHPLYASFGGVTPGVTYDPGARVIYPVDLPQGAYVQVQASITGATDYTCYARVRVEYVDQ